jgi:hypothetical protein
VIALLSLEFSSAHAQSRSQNPPPATIDTKTLEALRAAPGSAERLKRFLDAMTPVQKIHSQLYDAFSLGKPLDDAVTGWRWFQAHSPWDEPPRQTGILQDLRALKCSSDAVVSGRVDFSVSNPTANGTYIFTDHEILVTEVFKRPAGSVVKQADRTVITRPGGEVVVEGKVAGVAPAAFPALEMAREYLFFARFVQATGTFQTVVPEGVLELLGDQAHRLIPLWLARTERPVAVDRARLLTELRSINCGL